MTPKEAIEELKKVDTIDMPARLCEAHYIAIKALEQEPCGDAISRQAVLDLAERGILVGNHNYKSVCNAINDLLSVTPTERTGHWSRKTKVDAYDIAGVKTWGIKCQCDRCDFTTIVVEDFGYYKYCPNCGCRMVEPQESEVSDADSN